MKHNIKTQKRQDFYRVLPSLVHRKFLVFILICGAFAYFQVEKERIPESACLVSGEVEEDQSTEKVIPCGLPVGIYVKTEGLLVLDTQVLACKDGLNYEPAKNVVQAGDYIIEVNGRQIEAKEELRQIVLESSGEKISLRIKRDGKEKDVSINPVMTKDGDYKIGIWLRDDTQGLGTITYINGNHFGALGHGINDYDTGTQMKIEGGSLYEANIMSIKKGERGEPGELIGQVQYAKDKYIGTITSNDNNGIYGILQCNTEMLTDMVPVPVGNQKEIRKGDAVIRFVMDGETKDYEIKITKIDRTERNKKQGIMFEVTDRELIEKTGGVVQGMSGSPVIQNGRIVGAVTHVLVNDPTRGYGIFIENMLEAAE